MRVVIFSLLSSVEHELRAADSGAKKDSGQGEWKETATVVIQGVADLFGSHLHSLTAHGSFSEIWRNLIGHFRALLSLQILDINADTYSAVRDILHACAEQEKAGVGKESLDLAWDLWSQGIPVPGDGKDDKSSDNQKCLLVWVEALLELYGLIQADFSVERVRRMLTLLRDAMQHATPGAYASDIEFVTPLQGKILEVFRMVRTDLHGVPSAMIAQVAEFVSLAFAQENVAKGAEKRTYVAMSKESMSILQSLIVKNASEKDIYETGAFASALSALAKPVILKYRFKIVTKSVQPWRVATQSTLAVLEAALPQLSGLELPQETLQDIWRTIVSMANGIISADLTAPAAETASITDDQEFDIASFRQLRGLIIPELGAEVVLDETRKTYAEALFRTSIIHTPAPAEAAIIYGTSGGSDPVGLGAFFKKRDGRTIDPTPTKRSLMGRVCLDELFALVQDHSNNNDDDDEDDDDETPAGEAATRGDLHVRLARTVAPYLILRCALTLRGYVADQPLRGRMPQPLSQRKELAHMLRSLVRLRSEPDAIPDVPNVESERRKHLLRLYPLLVSAVQVAGKAGDEMVLGLVREALDAVGGEFGL
jgi:hypothetical protein